jgi:hypothetical protein
MATVRDRYELLVGGAWEDITGDVRESTPVVITRGQTAEGSSVADPQKMTLALDNGSGRYSARHPLSELYGKVGRNTPIRCYMGSTTHGVLPLAAAGTATTPDKAAWDTVVDLDVRAEVDATWSGTGSLVMRWGAAGNRSWALTMTAGGELTLSWTADGTTIKRAFSGAALTDFVASGRIAVRATLDTDNGAGGWTATFYYGPSLAGPWTMVGPATVTASGTTSVFAGSAPVRIGGAADLVTGTLPGTYYGVELRATIGGTVLASPTFTAAPDGAGAVTDAQGNVWTLNGATVINRNWRFHGEVSSWPSTWDLSGADAVVQITVSGITRRLGKGTKPIASALRRAIGALSPPPVAWWPLEDAPGAVQAASGLPNGSIMTLSNPTSTTFTAAPVEGTAGGVTPGGTGVLSGAVGAGTASGWCMTCWLDIPADMDAASYSALVIWQTPSATAAAIAHRIVVPGAAGGGAGAGCVQYVVVDDFASPVVVMNGAIDVRGRGLTQVTVTANPSGGGTAFGLLIDGVSDTAFFLPASAPGAVTSASIRPISASGGDYASTATAGTVSHLLVLPYARQEAVLSLVPVGTGYTGERAGDRIARLCAEEGVALVLGGATVDTAPMGPQLPAALLDLLAECATADGGLLYEPRDRLGVAYRTRVSLYNQVPAELEHVALAPVEDDKTVTNDVTAGRPGGSSARWVVQDGPLSIAAPPDGVGRYDTSVAVNVAADDQLAAIAGWLAHLGTVDEARYPSMPIMLHAPRVTAAETDTVLDLDVGDRIIVPSGTLPDWLPPGDIDQLVLGYTETIRVADHTVDLVAAPASPWDVAVTDDPVLGRVDTDGSSLAAAVTATATTLSVATIAGAALWTTASADRPFDIAVDGEVMTVTNITGASPQTFTVVRAVNGIAKSHASGADVRLAHPSIIAL